jgi:predicted GNAT family acetyltransferase
MSHEIKFSETAGGGVWTIEMPEDPSKRAYMSFTKIGENLINLNHTVVPNEFSGQGIAKKLLSAAVEYMRSNNLKTRPSCSFVVSQISKRPELQDVLDQG